MAHKEEEIEYGSVGSIFDTEIRGKIDAPWRLQRQIERCNVLISSDNVPAFDAAVRALMGDLPYKIKTNVLARSKEYDVQATKWIYTKWRGRRQGTPENPVLNNDPADWINYDPKQPTTVKSPIEVPDNYTDYERMLDVIKEEIELGHISWKYDAKGLNWGEVESPLSPGLTKRFTKAIVAEIAAQRKEGHVDVNFREAVASQLGLNPPTPSYPKEKVEQ